MFTDTDNFSEVIDCTLYRYNYVDNLLWGRILENKHKKLSKDSVIIDALTLKGLIINYFSSDINKIESTSGEILHKEATAIYFTWEVLKNIKNLRWVKFTLNRNAAYNRVVDIDGMPTIKWSLKTLRGTIYVYDLFKPAQLGAVNKIITKAGIMPPGKYFTTIKLKEIFNKMDGFLESYNTSEVATIFNPFMQALSMYEADNPEVLIVTDEDI